MDHAKAGDPRGDDRPVGLLITPWALFGLLWPVSELIGSQALPSDIWNAVETYALSQGARWRNRAS